MELDQTYFITIFKKGSLTFLFIRENRNSVAILTGDESEEDLIGLGKDIFTYFGLGCRKVSKFYMPEGYNFDKFFIAMYAYKEYINNYDYNKAVFLISSFLLLDNGFLVLKQDRGYCSPISSVLYEYYTDLESLKQRLKQADGINTVLFLYEL